MVVLCMTTWHFFGNVNGSASYLPMIVCDDDENAVEPIDVWDSFNPKPVRPTLKLVY